MKRFLAIALAASLGLVYAGTASAATGTGTYFEATPSSVSTYTAGLSANGIQASRHNLGSMGNFIHSGGATAGAGGTSEICVFCHTPHHTVKVGGTRNTNYAPAPLWNRQSVVTTFTGYGTTIGGTVETGTQIGGVTLACLSCHDGVTTFDNLVNAPGPGGLGGTFDAGGFPYTYGQAYTQGWGTNWIDEAGGPTSGANNLGGEARLNIGNTGGDLSNDHPMSIPYSDGSGVGGSDLTARASLRPRTTVIANIDLRAGLALSTTNSAELSRNLSQNLWASKGFLSNTAVIADMLRDSGDGIKRVECSSCHDPHFKNLSNVDLDNVTKSDYGIVVKNDGLFLRRVGGNAGSGVCRTCHNK